MRADQPAPPRGGIAANLWFFVRVNLARLRFIAILAAVGGTLAYWDTLRGHYEKWTRPLIPATSAADPDTEFWCPMHPAIVRDHPDKCPICAMPLSKRKKGEASADEPLPAGVVSRVQLTPYRVALAGVETAAVVERPLARSIDTVGFVEFDERKLTRIAARITGKSRIDKLYVNVTGQMVTKGDPLADLYGPDLVVTVQNLLDAAKSGNRDLDRIARDRLRLWGIDNDQIEEIIRTGTPITKLTIRSPMTGHVIKKYQVEGEYVEEGARLFDLADLSTVWVQAQVYEDELAFLHEGVPATCSVKAFPARAFRGTLAFVHPHLDSATRTLRVRMELDNNEHLLRPGMFASVRLDVPIARLPPFDALARHGRVPAVPDTAVIETGRRSIVYREADRGVFEGVEVTLGPRAGGFYPVAAGLAAGDIVAVNGSFLIDAETRLGADAGSTYFGASGGPQGADRKASQNARPSMVDDDDAKVQAGLAKLSAEDRRLATAQGVCPVLRENRLGVMGTPVKLILQGKPVFVCCKGCVREATENAARTLKLIGTPAPAATPAVKPAGTVTTADQTTEAEIAANLAKLGPEDRRLAEDQRFCAVQTDSRLGEMGPPVKLVLNGTPVFLCCKGCISLAKKEPATTVSQAAALRKGGRQ